MSALFVLVPLALLISAAFVGTFIWSVRRGQFDDLETPALRILIEQEAERHHRIDPEAHHRIDPEAHHRQGPQGALPD